MSIETLQRHILHLGIALMTLSAEDDGSISRSLSFSTFIKANFFDATWLIRSILCLGSGAPEVGCHITFIMVFVLQLNSLDLIGETEIIVEFECLLFQRWLLHVFTRNVCLDTMVTAMLASCGVVELGSTSKDPPTLTINRH